MLASLLLASELSFAPVCHVQAGIYKNFVREPKALIYVHYMDKNCGTESPLYESDTATITDTNFEEDEERAAECEKKYVKKCIEESDDPDCDVTDDENCPYLTFQAVVTGPPGSHKIQIYAPYDEGYAEVVVLLLRQPRKKK